MRAGAGPQWSLSTAATTCRSELAQFSGPLSLSGSLSSTPRSVQPSRSTPRADQCDVVSLPDVAGRARRARRESNAAQSIR